MTITDTFNRADSASSLGTTSDGTATWTANLGTWGISTNQAYSAVISGGGQAHATVPSLADGTVQATIAANPGTSFLGGILFRRSAGTDFWMFSRCGTMSVSGLWKYQAASWTQVAVVSSLAVGDVLSVVLLGSSIICKANGTTVATTTDSFNSTATAHGLYSEQTGNRYDDFSAPSVAAPPAQIWRPVVRSQAMSRASVI